MKPEELRTEAHSLRMLADDLGHAALDMAMAASYRPEDRERSYHTWRTHAARAVLEWLNQSGHIYSRDIYDPGKSPPDGPLKRPLEELKRRLAIVQSIADDRRTDWISRLAIPPGEDNVVKKA